MSKRLGWPAISNKPQFLADALLLADCESYERLLAGEASPAMFAADPADFSLLLCSAAAYALLDIGERDTLPLDLMSCIPELTEQKLRTIWKRVEEGNEATLEFEAKTANGRRVTIAIGFCSLQLRGRILLAGYLSDISDLKALQNECLNLSEEIAKREVELRHREIFENVNDGIFLLDVVDNTRFRCAGINPAMSRMSGLLRQDIIDLWIEDVLIEDTVGKLAEVWRRCVAERVPLDATVELQLPAGRKFLEMRSIPVENAAGRIHRLIVLNKDVTERKRTESEIGLMSFSLDRMRDAVFLFDTDASIRYVNRRACERLGYSREELLSMRFQDIDLGMDVDQSQILNGQNQALDGLSVETFLMDKDGRIIPVAINLSAFDYCGESVCLAVARDISERYKHQLNLHKQQKLLSEAQRIASLGSWEFDLVTNKLTWSEEVFRIFELDPISFKPSYFGFLNSIHPDDRKAVSYAYAESINERKPYQIEHRLLMADGRIKYVVERGETRYDDDGNALLSLGSVQDITERKCLEHNLMQREYEFRSLVQNMPGILARYDSESRFVYVNSAFEKTWGFSLSKLLGKRPTEVQGLADAKFFEDLVIQALQTGADNVFEHAVLDGEGRRHHCLIHIAPEKDDNGKVIHVQVLIRDISERKLVENELRANEARWKFALEGSGQGVWDWDLQTGKVEYSERYKSMLGYADAEFPNRLEEWKKRVHPEDIEAVSEVHRRHFEGNSDSYECEFRMRCKDGNWKWVLSRGMVVERDDRDRPLRMIGTHTDISQRKRLGLDLMRREQEFRALVESSPDLIFRYDPGCRRCYVNPAVERFSGKTAAELLGGRPSDCAILSGSEAEKVESRLREALVTQQAIEDEVQCIDVGGRLHYFNNRYVPEFDANGEVIGAITVAHDITHRREAEEALRRQLDFSKTLLNALCQVGIQIMVIEDGRIVYVGNRALAQSMGYTDAEVDGNTQFADIVHPDDRSRVLDYHRRRMAGENVPANYELGLIGKDGKRYDFEVAVAAIPNTDPMRIVTIGKDISERKAGEKHLAILNRALEQVGDAVILTDKDARLLYANRAFSRSVECRREDVLAMTVADFDPDHPLDRWPEHWRDLQTRESMLFESRHKAKSGRMFAVEISANYFEYEGIGYNLAVMRNIAQRKRTENILSFTARCGWMQGDEPFLIALARFLGETLSVDYVIIDKLAEQAGYAETVALYAKGEILPDMQYELDGTPCENVMDGGMCCYPADVQQAFPDDYLLVDMAVESYIGLPLWDSKGRVIGLIAVMDAKPIEEASAIGELLQIVAVRAAAELERGLAERALAESKQFLQQVIDTVADPIFVKDRRHRWLLLNRAYCRFMGQTLETLLGRSDYDFFPPAEAGEFWAKDEEVFENGGEIVNEEPFTDAEGVTRTIITSRTLFTDAHGETILVGTIKDITELKHAQREFENTANRLRSVLQTIPDYVWLKAPNGEYLACNPAFERLYGAKEVEIVGKTDYDFVAAELASFFRQKDLEAIIQGYVRIEEEWVVLAEDGGQALLETRKVPVKDTDGRVVGVLGIGRDITERKRMEDALSRSEREFRSLADNLPDNVARWDNQGCYVYLNPTCQTTIGVSITEVAGKRIGEVFPDGRFADIEAAIDRIIGNGTPVEFMQLPYWQNGELRFHDIKFVPEFDADGQIAGVLGIGRDMTDVYRMQEAIARREHEFRSLADNSPNHIVRYDREGRIRYLNSRLARDLGVAVGDVMDRLPSEVWPDGRFADIEHAAAKAVETGSEVVIELCWPNALGEFVYHQIRIAPETDLTGQVEGTLVIGWDITEIKRTERELALLNYAVNLSSDFIHLVDSRGRIVYANDSMGQVLGYSREQLLKLSISDIDPEFSQDRIVGFINQMSADASRHAFETVHQTRDGRRFPVEISAALFEYGGEHFSLAVARDITERKRQQERLDMQDYALNHVGDAIYLIDDEARFILVNDAVCKSLGYSRDELLSMSIFDIDPDFGPEQWQVFKASIEAGMLSMVLESRHRRRDGSLFPVEVSASYIPYQGRNLDMAIVRDISERKRAEQLLAQREREFRTLVENLPTYVERLDLNLRRIYVNPAFVASIGVDEAELLDSVASQYWRADNVSVSEYVKILKAALGFGERQEVTLEWKDQKGFVVCHLLRISPEFGIEGEIVGLLVLGFDVSEHRRQELLESERQRVFERVAHGDNLEGVLEQVALYIEASKFGRRCLITLLDEEAGMSAQIVAPSFSEAFRGNVQMLLAEDRCACPGWREAMATGNQVLIEDMRRLDCTWRCSGFIAESGAKAAWIEPIRSSSNQLLGMLTLYCDQEGMPGPVDQTLLLQGSHLCAIAIERKRVEYQMYRQASYDALTGLPNRRLFSDHLHEEIVRAEREGYELALLFIDLDRFKEVNDMLGHAVGDRLLEEAARRIRARVRESDIVARLAGDEFVAILPKAGDAEILDRITRQLVMALSEAFHFEDHSAFVSASIGIAVYPRDAINAEALLSCADQAMYAAKENGRNGYRFFTGRMLEDTQYRLQLAGDLRDALDKGQLEVYYQPIIDAASGKVLKAEALLRWLHPERGMVPPDQFIPIAEETDLIQRIGAWVFGQAAEAAKRWNGSCGDGHLRQISVNVSPRQFLRGNPDRAFISYLQECEVGPAAMVIEITEGLLLDDQADIQGKLECLKQAGMQLALDDFGTGYSAMAYLKKFDIDYLKIDKSFVRDLENDAGDRAIAEAIIAMAHRLGLKVIAEGVETAGQMDLLAEEGCEYLQGYFFAKPMVADAFFNFVQSYSGLPAFKEKCDVR